MEGQLEKKSGNVGVGSDVKVLFPQLVLHPSIKTPATNDWGWGGTPGVREDTGRESREQRKKPELLQELKPTSQSFQLWMTNGHCIRLCIGWKEKFSNAQWNIWGNLESSTSPHLSLYFNGVYLSLPSSSTHSHSTMLLLWNWIKI